MPTANGTINRQSHATLTIADDEAVPAGPVISASPTTVSRGSTTPCWSGIVNPTAQDWFHYTGWAAPTPNICHGSTSVAVPRRVRPGPPEAAACFRQQVSVRIYELRFLANDSFNSSDWGRRRCNNNLRRGNRSSAVLVMSRHLYEQDNTGQLNASSRKVRLVLTGFDR
jgi:hypothetical protein